MTAVVPHAGTWIEMILVMITRKCSQSFPTRERGLKFVEKSGELAEGLSFPTRERGLKSRIDASNGF